MLARLIHRRERLLATRDDDVRRTLPFSWGIGHLPVLRADDGAQTSDLAAVAATSNPLDFYRDYTRIVMADSASFYHLPPITDYDFDGELLTWTSAARTPSIENDTARARFFPAVNHNNRAVVVLPQWNSDAESHVTLCRLFARLGITALRLTMPYHEARRPAGLERADHLVSSDIGRTLQSVRQAVLDARACVHWLGTRGYERIGIMGTSIGSCTAFLTFAHEPLLRTAVFNHVSSYFADVVWRGISTRHVRQAIEPHLALDDLRDLWLPISPYPFVRTLAAQEPRPIRFISGRYDLTFPADLARHVAAEAARHNLSVDAAWLRCGHYTLGETPWKYIDGYKITSFMRKHL